MLEPQERFRIHHLLKRQHRPVRPHLSPFSSSFALCPDNPLTDRIASCLFRLVASGMSRTSESKRPSSSSSPRNEEPEPRSPLVPSLQMGRTSVLVSLSFLFPPPSHIAKAAADLVCFAGSFFTSSWLGRDVPHLGDVWQLCSAEHDERESARKGDRDLWHLLLDRRKDGCDSRRRWNCQAFVLLSSFPFSSSSLSPFLSPRVSSSGPEVDLALDDLLCFLYSLVFSRTAVTVWDMRSFRHPLSTASSLPNQYSETNIIFSPDDRHLLTGVSQRPGGEKKSGEFVVLAKEGLEVERRVDVGQGSILRVEWHSRINQVSSCYAPSLLLSWTLTSSFLTLRVPLIFPSSRS
jgi:hypothetical protein